MWDGIVTDNERTPLQIFVAPKAPATGDVPRILRDIRRLVDQAIKLSFLGARRPALDRLKTGIDDRLCSALADKLGIRPEQLQKSLDVLPELVLTFYADDAASASQNLRAAVAGGDRPIMARLLDNLARRLGMVPKNPEAQRSLFEAPPLPEVFQDPSFLATVKELWRGPVAELNTSPTA
jgi:hypothetical protein